jgi:hypothetical protein
MAGRAKENLPGGSLKYLFVYLKIRIFKNSYRSGLNNTKPEHTKKKQTRKHKIRKTCQDCFCGFCFLILLCFFWWILSGCFWRFCVLIVFFCFLCVSFFARINFLCWSRCQTTRANEQNFVCIQPNLSRTTSNHN